jgi:hypothetical protein
MNDECHFITHAFHYVSVHFVLIGTSLNRCPSLRTHCSNLARRFPSARLDMFPGPRFSGVHFRFEVSSKETITG